MKAVLLLLVLVVVVKGVSIEFKNELPFELQLLWDSGEPHRQGGALVPMGNIPASSAIRLNSHATHCFEIQLMSGRPVDVAQVSAQDIDHTFIIDGFRVCSRDGLELLTNTNSFFPFSSNYEFYTKTIVERKKRQALTPAEKDVLIQRKVNDKKRKWLNSMQPMFVPRLTEVGYSLSKLPDTVFKPLVTFYDRNMRHMTEESWKSEDQHVNHWEASTYLLEVPQNIKNAVLASVQPILETWVGGETPLELTSFYGIRTYTNQSSLLTHVDRSSTNAVSALIQVAQQVDDKWGFEVHGHDKEVKQLFTEPQEMILYESASVVHGRPQKLNGRYYANFLLHFRPKDGWNLKTL